MLNSIDGKTIRSIPKRRMEDFRTWRSRLSDTDYDRVVEAIRSRLNGEEVVVSSFLPGHDWTGTEFEPLYLACGKNVQQSGWFFGLIVWQVMIDHESGWLFVPATDDDDVQGMRYFRPQ